MISRFFQNVPGKSQVSLCINVTQSNAFTMKGTIAFSGTSTRDNRPAAGPTSFLLLYGITSAESWLSHLTSKLGVFRRTQPEIKTKITLKIGSFSDEQGLQNNFNRIYLYNSKMVLKFLTKLSLDALKKIYGLRNILFFPFSNKKIITLVSKSQIYR